MTEGLGRSVPSRARENAVLAVCVVGAVIILAATAVILAGVLSG